MLKWFSRLVQLEERLNNTIRFGVIKELDAEKNLVVVDFGEQVESPKIPYFISCSGNAMVYFTPKIGDQVVVLAKNGFLTQGFAMPCIYKGNMVIANDEWRLEFAQGAIKYKEGILEIQSKSEVTIQSPKANIKSDQIILGDDSGGEVVCKMHTCAFSGGSHS